jgi:hypothetical protein
MVLVVDFNMAQADGRIPALVPPGQASLYAPGTKVIAADGEGTECYAIVDEAHPDQRYLLLSPIGGTTRRDSIFRPSASDLFVD